MRKWARLRRDDGHVIDFTFDGTMERDSSLLTFKGVPRELSNCRYPRPGEHTLYIWTAPVGLHSYTVDIWTPPQQK